MRKFYRVGDRFGWATGVGNDKLIGDGLRSRHGATPCDLVVAALVGSSCRLLQPMRKGDITGQRVRDLYIVGIGITTVGQHNRVGNRFPIFNLRR